MTPRLDQPDEVARALAITDRNQKVAMVASAAGYAVWLVATFRFINMVEQTQLPPDVSSLLRFGALLLLFGGFATQFMVCNYINVMARRILRAIHLAQGAAGRRNGGA
jgi:hypothetical protein